MAKKKIIIESEVAEENFNSSDESVLQESDESSHTTEPEVMASLSEVKYLEPEDPLPEVDMSLATEDEKGSGPEAIVEDPVESISDNKQDILFEESALKKNRGVWPWWLMVALGLAVVIAVDWLIDFGGSYWFWSEQLIYTSSLFSLFVVCLAISYFLLHWQGRLVSEVYIINVLVALLSGIVLAVHTFIANTAFWTFFNLLAQPVDVIILSLAASWLGGKLFYNKLT